MVYYDNICNTIIKSPGQIRSKPGVTVPRCTSHCLASIEKTVFEHASEHQRNETSQFCEYTASTQLRTSYKNRKPNGLVKKDSMRKKLSKILLTDVAEQIKPVYETNCSRKKNFDHRITTSVPKKFFASEKSCFSQKTRTSRLGTKQVEKVYRRIPPHLTYIGILLTRELHA